jgi:hypothetical protein
MALSGIPIDPQQCIGDSLIVLNDSFIELDSRTLNLSGLVGTSSGNLFTTIQDVSGNLYTLIQESSANQTVPVKFSFTGNGSQLSFPLVGTDLSADAVSYRVDINGVIQEPNADYSIVGSDLVFSSAPPAGTKIVVVTAENYANMTITLSGFDAGVRALTGNWQNTYTTVNSNSATWGSGGGTGIDAGVRAISANWVTNSSLNANFLPLSGGTVTGPTRVNANLTVIGNLSATGNSFFANTVYSTTSALSVINIGNTGPAMYVGNNGTGDIASFFDLDAGVEILHVGGNNGTFPNVGIKTSTPGETLTVNGTLSTSGLIYSQGGVVKPLSGINGVVVNNNATNVTTLSVDVDYISSQTTQNTYYFNGEPGGIYSSIWQ